MSKAPRHSPSAISIHAPRVGSDGMWADIITKRGGFQSTLPVWGATGNDFGIVDQCYISIHAPRVGSDAAVKNAGAFVGYFNPRSPCGERPRKFRDLTVFRKFQSTLPVWGATEGRKPARSNLQFQSTLPVWGATRSGTLGADITEFQSTLPVWGATSASSPSIEVILFQSTLPVWGATHRACNPFRNSLYFNPRSPCGERLLIFGEYGEACRFQSTLPVWGATDVCNGGKPYKVFQSTLPVWGATILHTADVCGDLFQSTLPVWGATRQAISEF